MRSRDASCMREKAHELDRAPVTSIRSTVSSSGKKVSAAS